MKSGFIVAAIVFISVFIFSPVFSSGKIPIPSDSLVGLYHPFRDYYGSSYPLGIPFKNFLITDPVRQQYPYRYLQLEQMRSFELPLWNPYNFSGTPLLANVQSAPFYPLNFLFLVAPFSYAWSALVFLQPVLMGIFTYFYLRKIGLSYVSGLFGSVAFAFSGFSVVWMEWNTIGHTALWLPLILLSVEYLVQKMSIRWIFVFVFALSSQFLAGHLQTAFYLFVFSFVYIVARVFSLRPKEIIRKKITFSLKRLPPFIVLLGVVLLSTFFQWYPALQFIEYSARDVDQIFSEAPGWFIPYSHLAQFIAPDFFGNPTTLNYWGVWNYAELVGYVGLIPLIMAFFALTVVRRKLSLFFGLTIFICLLFSLPTPLAMLPFTFSIPFISTAQPTRLLFIIDFSLAVLAAIGFNAFERSQKRFFVPLGLVCVFLAILWATIYFNQFFSIERESLAVARRNLLLPTFIFITVVLGYVSTWFVRRKKFIFVVVTVFMLITIFDLTRFAQKFLPFTDPTYLYPTTKSLSFLKEQKGTFRILSVDNRILPPNTNIMYQLQTVEGYDPLYTRRYGELIAASERGSPSIEPPFGFNRIITPSNIDSNIIDLLGVRYVLSLKELESPKLKKVYQEGQTLIYENNEAFPRVFSVSNVLPVSTKQEAINALFESGLSLSSTAVVEGYGGNLNPVKSNVSLMTYGQSSVKIRSNSPGASFIVLVDTYYPTWKAAILDKSGKRETLLKIYLTDYNFRGIALPPGEHIVEFYNNLL